MKKLLTLLLTLLAADICAAEKPLIRIHTDQTDLLYRIDDQGRLCQSYLGPAFRNPEDLRLLPAGDEAFTTYGSKNYFTPALRLTHNDGNGSLQLAYVSHETRSAADGVTETSILLRDEAYPVEVKLILTAFERENVIKSRTEIVHYERKPVTLYEYASSMLRLGAGSYYLTEFTGDWAHEVNKSERRLDFGKKVLDSSLGSRANMFCPPLFAVTLDGPMSETEGEVLLGTLAWTGNFRFTFEVDQNNGLRILSGINPFASEYSLRPREIFRTPEFIFTFSTGGAGSASRSLHDWARRHQLKDGGKDRMTLLNNWEATYFDFNEENSLRSWTTRRNSAWTCSCSTTDGSATSIRGTTTRRDSEIGTKPAANCPAASPDWSKLPRARASASVSGSNPKWSIPAASCMKSTATGYCVIPTATKPTSGTSWCWTSPTPKCRTSSSASWTV